MRSADHCFGLRSVFESHLIEQVFTPLPVPPSGGVRRKILDYLGKLSCARGQSRQGPQAPLHIWVLEEARRQGVSDGELLQDYPGLCAADLTAAWAYVEAHPAEIENAIQANLVA